MGQLIRIPEKPPHTFLFNCFSKLHHHISWLHLRPNQANSREGFNLCSLQSSPGVERRPVCVWHLKNFVSELFFLSFPDCFQRKALSVHCIRTGSSKAAINSFFFLSLRFPRLYFIFLSFFYGSVVKGMSF